MFASANFYFDTVLFPSSYSVVRVKAQSFKVLLVLNILAQTDLVQLFIIFIDQKVCCKIIYQDDVIIIIIHAVKL